MSEFHELRIELMEIIEKWKKVIDWYSNARYGRSITDVAIIATTNEHIKEIEKILEGQEIACFTCKHSTNTCKNCHSSFDMWEPRKHNKTANQLKVNL